MTEIEVDGLEVREGNTYIHGVLILKALSHAEIQALESHGHTVTTEFSLAELQEAERVTRDMKGIDVYAESESQKIYREANESIASLDGVAFEADGSVVFHGVNIGYGWTAERLAAIDLDDIRSPHSPEEAAELEAKAVHRLQEGLEKAVSEAKA